MTLATKNGSLIVKDGKLAENCDCCGKARLYSWAGDVLSVETNGGTCTFRPHAYAIAPKGLPEYSSITLFYTLSKTLEDADYYEPAPETIEFSHTLTQGGKDVSFTGLIGAYLSDAMIPSNWPEDTWRVMFWDSIGLSLTRSDPIAAQRHRVFYRAAFVKTFTKQDSPSLTFSGSDTEVTVSLDRPSIHNVCNVGSGYFRYQVMVYETVVFDNRALRYSVSGGIGIP